MDLVPGVMELLGATEASRLSTIAYITVDEYELMINVPTIAGIPITPVARSKMRHIIACCSLCDRGGSPLA